MHARRDVQAHRPPEHPDPRLGADHHRQAAEFDDSGTQAVRALREEGYRVILCNSNPAAIVPDPDLADATSIEPITR
jgi:hypothetical protein